VLNFILVFMQNAESFLAGPREGATENTIINFVQWVKLIIETTGAIIICIGAAIAIYKFIRAVFPPKIEGFNQIRLVLARYLALALEFQLGADILSTAIAPSWEQIGKLGAIAVIRTALNYFLMQEMKEERKNEDSSD
jgi:uncharacterized membrane protein